MNPIAMRLEGALAPSAREETNIGAAQAALAARNVRRLMTLKMGS
jgi:hypothetical protein